MGNGRISRLGLAFVAGSAVVAALAPVVARAQLEEIVVTAQKREQSLQDVPISLSVVDGERLSDFSIGSFEELDVYMANMYIKETPGNNAIYMRGIGSSPGNLAFEQSVSLFVDGVYAGRGRQFQAPFLDIDRIEVLRGPQGALVGKNTAAGAVSIISSLPTEEFEGRVTGGYEFEREGYEVSGFVSGPLGDGLRGRLAVKYVDRDGYLTNRVRDSSEPREEDFVIRATTALDASESVEVIGKVEFSKSDNAGTPAETLGPNELDAGSLDQRKATDGVLSDDFDDTDAVNATVRVNWDLGEHRITSITAYSKYNMDKVVDSDFSAFGMPPRPGVLGTVISSFFEENFDQFSQEVRLASPTGQAAEYVVGLYYHTQDLSITRGTDYLFGPFNGTQTRLFSQDGKLWSAYGQLTWNLSDAVRAIASLRHTSEDKDVDLVRTIAGRAPPLPVPNNFSDGRSESQTDPAVTLQWDASDNAMLYASYSRGSKGGGFNGASNTATPDGYEYEDEESSSMEVGAKLSLLDGNATLNLAVFFDEYKNMQRSAFDGESFTFTTRNAAVAQSKGVEVDGTVRINDYFTLAGSWAYLNSEYDDFPDSGCIALPIAAPCTPEGQDISGTPLPHAPDWSGNVALNFEQTLDNGLALFGNLVVAYQDAMYLDDTLAPRLVQDGFAKVDLRMGLSGAEDKWEVAVVGKNLSDKFTAQHGFQTPVLSGFGYRTLYTEPGRTVSLTGTMRF